MKKYTFTQHLSYWGEIEADTEEEAREIWERYLEEDEQRIFDGSSDVELVSVEEITD